MKRHFGCTDGVPALMLRPGCWRARGPRGIAKKVVGAAGTHGLSPGVFGRR
jgi:hypothetical protein